MESERESASHGAPLRSSEPEPPERSSSLASSERGQRQTLESAREPSESLPESKDHFGYFAQWSELIARRRRQFQSTRRALAERALRAGLQLGFFCGFFTTMWTLTHLDPAGDSPQTLCGLLLFALPVAAISPTRRPWQRALGRGYVLLYWIAFGLCCHDYFFSIYRFNYSLRWLLIALAMVLLISWLGLRPRPPQRRSSQAEQSSLVLWLGGILVSLAALATERYEMAYGIEPNTANILSGFTFTVFLSLACIRVLWLDGIRWYRAKRIHYPTPEDYVFFLEWLIPRSFSFISILTLLLLSEALFFSTIYRTKSIRRGAPASVIASSPTAETSGPPSPAQRPVAGAPAEADGEPDLLPRPPAHAHPLTLPGLSALSAPLPLISPTVRRVSVERAPPQPAHTRFGEWAFFAFKPYVFPKRADGIEVDAPNWFKYLGRALLGFVIAILLSQQLRLWRDIRALYLSLLYRRRRAGLLRPREGSDSLWEERLHEFGSIFDVYAVGWRWLILRSTVSMLSPKWLGQRLLWRSFFDLGGVAYECLERLLFLFKKRWHLPLFGTSVLLGLICGPLTAFYSVPSDGLWNACFPALTAGLLIYLIFKVFGRQAPTSYHWILWWLLLLHFVAALVLFFLISNLGARDAESWWQNLLWFLQLVSVSVFPMLYLFGGGRARRPEILVAWDPPSGRDHEIELRRALLLTFSLGEQRLWLAQRFTQWLHPLRGGGLRWRLIGPSLLLNFHESCQRFVQHMSELLRRILDELLLATSIWFGLQLAVVALTLVSHLLVLHGILVQELWRLYLIGATVLLAPTLGLLFFLGWRLDRARRSSPGTPLPESRRALRGQLGDEAKRITRFFAFGLLCSFSLFAWLLYSSSLLPSGIVLTLIFCFAPPWLPLRSLRAMSATETQRGDRFEERLLRWLAQSERFVQRKQETLKTTLYEQAANRRRVEPLLAETLAESCAVLIEGLHQALRDGRWQRGEEASIQRVYHQWLTGESEREELRLQRELFNLYEQILDALGASLHDLTLSEGRASHLFVQEPKVLVSSLIRICRCPNPLSLADDSLSEEVEELKELFVAINELALHLLSREPTELPPRFAEQLLEQELRSLLIELYVASAQLLPEELLSRPELIRLYTREERGRPALLWALLQEPESAALISQLEERLAVQLSLGPLPLRTIGQGLHELPSPIAAPLLHWVRLTYRAATTLELPSTTYNGRVALQEQRSARWDAICAVYRSALGLCLALFQKAWEEAKGETLSFSVVDRQSAIDSLGQLRRIRCTDEVSAALQRRCLTLFPSTLPVLKGGGEGQRLQWGEEQLLQLISRLLEASLPAPLLHSARTLDRREYPPRALRLRGLRPELIEQAEEPPQTSAEGLPEEGAAVLSGALQLRGVERRAQLEFYSAIWSLQQLTTLLSSESLFSVQEELARRLSALTDRERPKGAELKAWRRASRRALLKERVSALQRLTRRLRLLLPTFSPEEERLIQRACVKLYERLELLEHRVRCETLRGGSSGSDFTQGLARLTGYLDLIESHAARNLYQLISMRSLPSEAFLFFEGEEQINPYERCAHYRGLIDGQPLTRLRLQRGERREERG